MMMMMREKHTALAQTDGVEDYQRRAPAQKHEYEDEQRAPLARAHGDNYDVIVYDDDVSDDDGDDGDPRDQRSGREHVRRGLGVRLPRARGDGEGERRAGER